VLRRLIGSLPAAVGLTPPPAHATDALAFWRVIGAALADLVTVNAATIAEATPFTFFIFLFFIFF